MCTSEGSDGTSNFLQYGLNAAATASITTACSCLSFAEASNAVARRSSSIGSSLRAIEPANGLDLICIPALDISSSGLAPINVREPLSIAQLPLVDSIDFALNTFTPKVYPRELYRTRFRRR
ncbi:hypothetical protein D3C76_1405050 [compost metagenome]